MHKFYFSFFLLLCISLIIPSVAYSKQQNTYRIGRSDILDISVWQSPDLTKSVEVNSDGTITYPILGDLPAAGATVAELEKMIQEKLSQGYVKDPKVNIIVKEYNSKKILVFGEVGKPGLYKLKGPVPLLELLFMVGGTTKDGKRMTVIRSNQSSGDAIPEALLGNSQKVMTQQEDNANAIEVDLIALLSKGDLSQNISILPGDTIYVGSGTGQKFYVLGQVSQPGPVEWVEEITVLEAIKLAGGGTPRAALNRITVRQNRGGKEQTIKINVVDIMKGKKKDDTVVMPGDVIIVPESWI